MFLGHHYHCYCVLVYYSRHCWIVHTKNYRPRLTFYSLPKSLYNHTTTTYSSSLILLYLQPHTYPCVLSITFLPIRHIRALNRSIPDHLHPLSKINFGTARYFSRSLPFFLFGSPSHHHRERQEKKKGSGSGLSCSVGALVLALESWKSWVAVVDVLKSDYMSLVEFPDCLVDE